MSDITSGLKLIDLSVEELKFKRNYEFDAEAEIELLFNFGAKIEVREEQARLKLTCDIFDEDFINKNLPFFLKASMYGFFESKDTPVEDFQVNCIAILLPYLRALITSFTAQAGLPPVIIPPINVYSLVKQQQEANEE